MYVLYIVYSVLYAYIGRQPTCTVGGCVIPNFNTLITSIKSDCEKNVRDLLFHKQVTMTTYTQFNYIYHMYVCIHSLCVYMFS